MQLQKEKEPRGGGATYYSSIKLIDWVENLAKTPIVFAKDKAVAATAAVAAAAAVVAAVHVVEPAATQTLPRLLLLHKRYLRPYIRG